MHARMLSVVVFLPELSTVARRVLLLELSTHCSRQLYELVLLLRCSRARRAALYSCTSIVSKVVLQLYSCTY